MLRVSVWTYRTVDLLLFHFNFLSSLIDMFLPLLLYLIILVLFICLFVFYHATKCAIACHSEWHHWRRHVSQRWWKKDVGQGVGRKSQGQVSCHTFSDIHWVSCGGLSYFFYLYWRVWVHVCACLHRMDEVIVHIGCMSLKESQELVCYSRPAWKTALQLEIHLIIINLRVKYNVKLMYMIH